MAGDSYTKTSRCWPGFEPVPGKSEHEEHSCRKKPKKRNGGEAVDRETARKKQVARGGERSGQAKAAGPLSTAQKAAAKKAGATKAAKAGAKTTAKRTGAKKATKAGVKKAVKAAATKAKKARVKKAAGDMAR